MPTPTAPARPTPFTDAQLTYAAHARCPCGAGLAYPVDPTMRQMREWSRHSNPLGMWDHWDCSDILTARAVPNGQPGSRLHTDWLPFAFYEIKSENQPSAHGATTRPVKLGAA